MCNLHYGKRLVPFLTVAAWRCFLVVAVLLHTGRGMQWKTQPQDQNVTIGGQAMFPCEAQGTQDKEHIWNQGTQTIFINGQRNANVSPRYNVTETNTLVITNVALVDDFFYTCNIFGFDSVQARLTVLVIPGQPFITTNSSSQFVENSVISFTCSSSGGKPSPNIQWLRNGQPIANDILTVSSVDRGVSTSQIIVTLSRMDHNANYSCIVFNQANQNSPLTETKILNVQYSPFIQFQPNFSPYRVKSGSSVTLRCVVDSNPPYSNVTWKRERNGIKEILNVYSDTWMSSSAQDSDSANYTCTAINIIQGSPRITSALTVLDVLYAPKVTTMTVITANISTQVNLSCSVKANPPVYEMQWHKLTGNSITLVSSQANAVFFANKYHSGNYSCTAFNLLEPSGLAAENISAKGFTTLQVQYAPGTASIQPISTSFVNQTITLSCNVDDAGYPFPIYEWYRVETSQILQSSKSPDYIIVQAALSDNGNYTCIPKNLMGSGIAALVSVEINSQPVFVSSSPSSNLLTIPINQSNVVLKHVIEGRPQPAVQWFKDDVPLSQMFRLYTVETTSVMVDRYKHQVSTKVLFTGPDRDQNKLQIADIGTYKCQVLLSGGTPSFRSTYLSVEFSPIVSTANNRVAADLGENATLICTAQSNPIPAFFWFKQGQNLSNNSKMVMNQHLGKETATYQTVLFIKYIDIKDFGEYTCEANNVKGQMRTGIMLSEKNKPDPPTNLLAIEKTWESVYLQWSPGFNGGYEQSFVIVVHSIYGPQVIEVNPRGVNTFNVTKLKPATAYTFSVCGSNILGKGTNSASYITQTDVLMFPALKQIPEFNVENKQLFILNNLSQSYCFHIKVSTDNGQSWTLTHACAITVQNTITLLQQGATNVNVSVCLVYRQDVCGEPVTSKINAPKTPDLTETQVIIIGCVCAAILIALLIVLLCIIIKRRERNKNYNGNVNGSRPVQQGNGAILTQKPNIYENQDVVQIDNRNGYPICDTSYGDNLNEYEMNRHNANHTGQPIYNGKQDPTGTSSYYNGKQDLPFNDSPRTPTKDTPKFIGIPEEHTKEGGSFGSGNESGYSTPDKVKPLKKVIYEVVV